MAENQSTQEQLTSVSDEAKLSTALSSSLGVPEASMPAASSSTALALSAVATTTAFPAAPAPLAPPTIAPGQLQPTRRYKLRNTRSASSTSNRAATSSAPSTTQKPKTKAGKYANIRGPAPNGVSEEDWDKAYNRADSRIARAKGNSEANRKNGMTRKLAIKLLVEDKVLPKEFIDEYKK